MKTEAHWAKIGRRFHNGVCLPLFSLHSKTSCGIGEFFDLLPLIDWCAEVGFDVIQLLPLFDTADDPSPYNPISSCALNPIYLSLTKLPDASSCAEFAPLNALKRVDYVKVKAQKFAWLMAYFHRNFRIQDEEFQHFVHEQSWLLPYAKFKSNLDGAPVDFHCYLQYLCHLQLRDVHAYAAREKVFLKGDLPYLMNRGSVDVQESPHLFNLNLQAGAPPDYYNPNGQNWGCPIFNWDAMREDNFHWWKRRMKAIEPYYDLYRIDHVVGLFRIWAIEQGKMPTEGSFVPADQALWLDHGRQLLEMMIDASPLLPMAEDLGTIPPEVRVCLKELGICGTKVIRWERDWNGDRRFIPFHDYEPISLTTCSTMDSDTVRGWWQKYPEEAADFAHFMGWDFETVLSTERLKAILQSAYHTPSFFHINLLQDVLAIFPELVSQNPDDERINIPGTQLPQNWSYRFKLSVEEIATHAGLKDVLQHRLLGPH